MRTAASPCPSGRHFQLRTTLAPPSPRTSMARGKVDSSRSEAIADGEQHLATAHVVIRNKGKGKIDVNDRTLFCAAGVQADAKASVGQHTPIAAVVAVLEPGTPDIDKGGKADPE